MHVSRTHILVLTLTIVTSGWPVSDAEAQSARIHETTRVLTTYPFSEPNPVPILTRDERLYPYHAFDSLDFI